MTDSPGKYDYPYQPPEKPKRKFSGMEWLILSSIMLVFLALLIQPYFEMRAFNKFRDPHKPAATYWDAMFGELRITSE